MLEQVTHIFITYLKTFAEVVPLPVFTFLGSIIEEIIAPIPSPLVMTIAGSIAATRNSTYLFIFFVAVTGAIGKTLASVVMYVIADKFEDVVLAKFGKFLGVTHREVERIGRHLNKGRRDYLILIALRAIPIIPSAPVSVVSGLVKISLRTFIIATFLGSIVRNLIYLSIGFTGANATESLIIKLEDFEIVGYVIVGLMLVGILVYILFSHKKEAILHKIFHKQDHPSS